MLRGIGAIIAALVVWFVVATAVHRVMCLAWPAYATATPLMVFSLPMKVARLLLGAFCTLIAGAVARRISPASWVALVVGCVLLLLFLPEHFRLWARFPVWYHLSFLGYLIPLSLIGSRFASARRTQRA